MKGKISRIFKNVKWAINQTYKYYDRVNFKRLISWQLIKIKVNEFDLVIKR